MTDHHEDRNQTEQQRRKGQPRGNEHRGAVQVEMPPDAEVLGSTVSATPRHLIIQLSTALMAVHRDPVLPRIGAIGPKVHSV